ncbi:MAG: SDR family NAD-dependent epimerase/dehydratase, partial [Candidatus Omnitrophica bacterium]|nr:SDR family NAD-dependent epimerase/dehydratase [Candidatus Omnitrophota bacterium]
LVEGIYKLMLSSEHGPVNLGNPDEFTILEFAKMVTCFTRTSSKIVYKPLPQDDPRQRRPDISKAKRILKWSPKISLKDGLQKTIEWFKINHSRLE